MSAATLWSLAALIVFIVILAVPRIPNWMTFLCVAPIVVFSGTMSASDVYGVLGSSGLHLMMIICMFSGMIAATGLDIVIGNAIGKMTGKLEGEKKEMAIFAILYVIGGLISFLLQNSYVAMAFLPIIFSIAKQHKISHSKMVLFMIYATTLGGACTLIGTPTNVYANTALEEAGLAGFGMLDFAWVGLPIFVIGGLYMIVMNRWCPSYEETLPVSAGAEMKELTSQQKKKQMIVGISFFGFVAALVVESFFKIKCNPNFIGYGLIALVIISLICCVGILPLVFPFF